ncbi:MAG: hypothetical protein AAFV29_15980, partial [Myxococcota bacterium]
TKSGNGRRYTGFDVTVTSTPAWLSVKAGPDVFGVSLVGGLAYSWDHPGGTHPSDVKAISNVVLCDQQRCDAMDAPPNGPDAGLHPDADVAEDAGGPMDAGMEPDGGVADGGSGGL